MTGPHTALRTGATRAGAVALAVLVAALVTCGMAAPVAAAPEDARVAAKAEVEKAAVQYKLGRFDEALEGYSRAYELVNAPGLLFNIGQCHRNMKSYERAIFFFQQYLREETNPDRRRLATELIAETKDRLEKQQAAPAEAPEPETPPASSPWLDPPLPPDEGLAMPGLDLSAGNASKDEPLTKKWWFWTGIGGGVLAIAAVAIVVSVGSGNTVLPSGSVGTLDRRQ